MDLNIYNKELKKLLNKNTLIILQQISKDYNIKLSELKRKYIIKEKKNKISGYHIFLSDKNINEKIKDNNSDKKLLIKKSNIWKNMTDEEKEYYNNLAIVRNSMN